MIFLLRFIAGYVVFTITGSRAGSFINEINKRRINVWGIKAKGGVICCKTAMSDYPEVQRLCRGTSQRVHIIAKRGLPFIIKRNRKRSGLFVGAVLFFAVFSALSRFVWCVDICSFDNLSASSAREILERVGICEGVKSDFESLKRMQTSALLEFGDLSWITINVDGSRGEVNATEKIAPETNDTAPRNIVASADGQIIRVDPYSGTAAVSAGDGVIRGDLLISGIVETELGGTRTVRADGVVMAKTYREEQIIIPKKRTLCTANASPKTRYSAKVFGVTLPLTTAQASGESIFLSRERQAYFYGERASASLIEENIYEYTLGTVSIDRAVADELFERRRLIREVFGYNDRAIDKREISCEETDDAFIYTVNYVCEEDIAQPKALMFQ